MYIFHPAITIGHHITRRMRWRRRGEEEGGGEKEGPQQVMKRGKKIGEAADDNKANRNTLDDYVSKISNNELTNISNCNCSSDSRHNICNKP